jgi:phosphoglycolate phosphatase
MKKLLIFDFDGTIANTLNGMYEIYLIMAKKYKIDVLTKEAFIAYKKLPILERLQKQNIPLYVIPKIVSDSQKLQMSFLSEAKPFEGIHNLLHELKTMYTLIIVSSNKKDFIKAFLKNHDLMVFDKIYGKAQLFGKAETIKKAIKKMKSHTIDSLYIGDETRDIVACRELQLDIISVSYGYDDKTLLVKEGAKHLIDAPNALLSMIKSFH